MHAFRAKLVKLHRPTFNCKCTTHIVGLYDVQSIRAKQERWKFPLTADTSFCNPRSPLRSRSAHMLGYVHGYLLYKTHRICTNPAGARPADHHPRPRPSAATGLDPRWNISLIISVTPFSKWNCWLFVCPLNTPDIQPRIPLRALISPITSDGMTPTSGASILYKGWSNFQKNFRGSVLPEIGGVNV